MSRGAWQESLTGANGLEPLSPKLSEPHSGRLSSWQLATHLAAPACTNAGYPVLGAGPLPNGFLAVTDCTKARPKSR